jgi:hypothetical protein
MEKCTKRVRLYEVHGNIVGFCWVGIMRGIFEHIFTEQSRRLRKVKLCIFTEYFVRELTTEIMLEMYGKQKLSIWSGWSGALMGLFDKPVQTKTPNKFVLIDQTLQRKLEIYIAFLLL